MRKTKIENINIESEYIPEVNELPPVAVKPKKRIVTTNRIIAVLFLLLIISISSAVYFYSRSSVNAEKEAKKELEDVIQKVERLMFLPPNETPTLATVSDPEKLKDQKFFANAQKGDKVLVFPISRKAILYSPSSDKIIEVAPVDVSSNPEPSI